MKLKQLFEAQRKSFDPADITQAVADSIRKYYPKVLNRAFQEEFHLNVGGNTVRDTSLGSDFDEFVNDVGSDYGSAKEFMAAFNADAKQFATDWVEVLAQFTAKVVEPARKAKAFADTLHGSDDDDTAKNFNKARAKLARMLSAISSFELVGNNDVLKLTPLWGNDGFDLVHTVITLNGHKQNTNVSAILDSKVRPEEALADVIALFVSGEESICAFMGMSLKSCAKFKRLKIAPESIELD
jgi:hypothetical protein